MASNPWFNGYDSSRELCNEEYQRMLIELQRNVLHYGSMGSVGSAPLKPEVKDNRKQKLLLLETVI